MAWWKSAKITVLPKPSLYFGYFSLEYSQNEPHSYPTGQGMERIFVNFKFEHHFDALVQERRNSIANALELCLSCSNPSI